MIPAVAYLRVSGTSQLDGTGFERQLESCTALANTLQLALDRTFEERAISGTTEATDRPAFQAMIAHLLDNGIKIILIEGMHRLAREYRVQEQLLLYLAAKGLTLYAADTGEDITAAILADPMKKALVQIQGIFAELDKSMIVAKLRKGRQITKAKVGRCEGRKPYGHYPGEGMTLAAIQANRALGMTCAQIADTLNSRQLPARSGGPWRGPVVAKILARERLTQELRSACA